LKLGVSFPEARKPLGLQCLSCMGPSVCLLPWTLTLFGFPLFWLWSCLVGLIWRRVVRTKLYLYIWWHYKKIIKRIEYMWFQIKIVINCLVINKKKTKLCGIDVLYMIHLYNIIMVYIHEHFDLRQHFMCKGKSSYIIFYRYCIYYMLLVLFYYILLNQKKSFHC